MTRTSSTTMTTNWAVEVATRMRGVDFPLTEEEARKRLKGVRVEGQNVLEFLDNIEFPLDTPADLLHAISKQTGVSKVSSSENWSVKVAKALEGADFPLTKEEAKRRFRGIEIRGKDISRYLNKLKYPMESPTDLLHQISQTLD
jgi:predicted transcriptional regulator